MVLKGWSVLPIIRHDSKDTKKAGKAPGILGWTAQARYGAPLPTQAQRENWLRQGERFPGTGIACGNVVVIDIDVMSDPTLAEKFVQLAFDLFGATPLVRQGQPPKVALIYRAAEPIESLHFKLLDRSGDGLDILAMNTLIVAFGIHRVTREPYRWIGAEAHSPLTLALSEVPAVSASQVTDYVRSIREVVELSTTGGRRGDRARNGIRATCAYDSAGKVIDGREMLLYRMIYQAAKELNASGCAVDTDEIAKAGWKLFADKADLSRGNWSYGDARRKALALVGRIACGTTSFAPKLVRTTPSYPDTRCSLREAEQAVANVINAFFDDHVEKCRKALASGASQAGSAQIPLCTDHLMSPSNASWGVRIEAAVGKTAAAVARVARAVVEQCRSIVYAVPTHQLGDELVDRFKDEGIEARVYRGYTAVEKDSDTRMCLDQKALEAARAAGVNGLKAAICERDSEEGEFRCRLHSICGMTLQRKQKPQVWIIPHALLFQPRPEFIPAPDAIVVDEGFLSAALHQGQAVMITLDAIEHGDANVPKDSHCCSDSTKKLMSLRERLVYALRAHQGNGPLRQDLLLANGIVKVDADQAYHLERQRAIEPGLYPGMDSEERRKRAERVGPHNKTVKVLASVWAALNEFLEADTQESGRVSVKYHSEKAARVLELRPLATFHASWAAPAILLDATLPDPMLLTPVLGHDVQVKSDVAARWSPHGKVRQIVGAPVAASKLGIVPGKETDGDGRNVAALVRLIKLRAALATGCDILVVGQKSFIGKLKAFGLPNNVQFGHFGALAGLDKWKDAAGLICIGRPLPAPSEMEADAGVITGRPAASISGNGESWWYERKAGGIRLGSGDGIEVVHIRHPDPVAEALRWLACEASIIQAIARIRPLRRKEDNPYFIDIVSDVPLPICVDEVVSWDKACPGRWADMAPSGVLLDSATDIETAFPELAPTRKVARALANLTLAQTHIEKLFIGVRARVTPVRRTYKKAGRSAPAEALVLPGGPTDLSTWLEAKLGFIEWVRNCDTEKADCTTQVVMPDNAQWFLISLFGSGETFRSLVDFAPDRRCFIMNACSPSGPLWTELQTCSG